MIAHGEAEKEDRKRLERGRAFEIREWGRGPESQYSIGRGRRMHLTYFRAKGGFK